MADSAAEAPPRWLTERWRSGTSATIAVVVTVTLVLVTDDTEITAADGAVLALFSYLLCYLLTTIVAFSRASRTRILDWAERESRGSFWQRYVFGTAPGPGASLFIATGALAVAVLWLPADSGVALGTTARIGVAVALVAIAWACVVVSFAVAFHADNLVEREKALVFPNRPAPDWSDYVYFAIAVMATFGTTDVTVTSSDLRRTVTTNAVIAFVFNTVTVATLVSALGRL